MKKIKSKVLNFFKWIWNQVKDWHNLVILLIVAAVLFLICLFIVALGLFLIDKKIHLITAGGIVLAFWMGPFTPFWPLCIAITLGIRKFIEIIFYNKSQL